MSGIVGQNLGRGSGLIKATSVVADSVTGSEIADDAIDSEHYTDGSIDNAHVADDAIDSEHYAAGSIDTAHIADNQITLAKMAGGTDGNIISYDASGDPVAIATGSDGQVLTSTGAGSPPAFEAVSSGGGKIGQAVTATRADDTSITSTTYADSNCTVAITPSAADSKILVHISIPTWIYRGGYVSCRYGAKINRAISGGATTALVTSGARNNLGGRLSDSPGSDDDVGVMFNYTLLDAPSTSSAVTYSVQFALDNADGTSFVLANVSDTTSYMTSLEVLA